MNATLKTKTFLPGQRVQYRHPAEQTGNSVGRSFHGCRGTVLRTFEVPGHGTKTVVKFDDRAWAFEAFDGFRPLHTDCGHELRTGPCRLALGHKGRHSTVVFTCDLCDTTYRGVPDRREEEGVVCFLCTLPARRIAAGSRSTGRASARSPEKVSQKGVQVRRNGVQWST